MRDPDFAGYLPSLSDRITLSVICGIAAADTVDDVWRQGVAALTQFGFERINYGFTVYRVGVGIGDPDDAFFLSTHAPEAVRGFHQSGAYLRSADFRWVRDNSGACSWGWVHGERAAGRLSDEECAVMDQLGSGRRCAGYTISFPVSQPRSKGAMGMAAPHGVSQSAVDAHWRTHETSLMAIAQTMHLKLSQMPRDVSGARLTKRQREILDFLADGKSLRDICEVTGLSRSAVEKHLRLAREALGVETTAHAVAKVSFLNQLFVQS